jgi:hypothetical protein
LRSMRLVSSTRSQSDTSAERCESGEDS